jgi:inorganic pyrophosphatase
MVVEIPRGTRAKLEISRTEPLNPIKQDMKKGKLRYIHDPYCFNYGAFPQTWEDPTHVSPDTNAAGDLDPLDVCEVGEQVGHTGQIKQVKILGVWAMVDDVSCFDWEMITVNLSTLTSLTGRDGLEGAGSGRQR